MTTKSRKEDEGVDTDIKSGRRIDRVVTTVGMILVGIGLLVNLRVHQDRLAWEWEKPERKAELEQCRLVYDVCFVLHPR